MIRTIDEAVSFLRRYHRHLAAPPSLGAAIIPSDLPYALALVYRELGGWVEIDQSRDNNYKVPFSTQDGLVDLSRLKRIGGLIEFAWENQGNWSARCEVGAVDPPVLTNAGDGSGSSTFEVVCDSVSRFLVTLGLQEAVMSSPILLNVNAASPHVVFELPLADLWLSGPYAVLDDTRDFYELDDGDVLVMDWAGIWVGSYSEAVTDLLKPQYRDRRMP